MNLEYMVKSIQRVTTLEYQHISQQLPISPHAIVAITFGDCGSEICYITNEDIGFSEVFKSLKEAHPANRIEVLKQEIIKRQETMEDSKEYINRLKKKLEELQDKMVEE
jgi:hypothetical protein